MFRPLSRPKPLLNSIIRHFSGKKPNPFNAFKDFDKSIIDYASYLEKKSPDIKDNINEIKNAYNNLSQSEKMHLSRHNGLEDVIKNAPPSLKVIPDFPVLITLISKIMESPEMEELLGTDPISQMETNLKTVSEVVDGVYGHASWRTTIIGGHLDEYAVPAPEHVLSPWHDIGLEVKSESDPDLLDDSRVRVQMFVTMPKNSKYLNTVVKDERMNPVRHVLNKAGGAIHLPCKSPFNMGILPQTWNDPRVLCPIVGNLFADDFLLAVDLSGAPSSIGPIRVKVLGSLGVVSKEDNRVRWVMLCYNLTDPLSIHLNNMKDVETWLPGLKSKVKDFVRDVYSSSSGGVEYFEKGKVHDWKNSYKVLSVANKLWETLITKYCPPPRTFYLHHPLIRNGEMTFIDNKPSNETLTDHALGLSIEDRVKEKWMKIDRKETFYKSEYFEHMLKLEKRKNGLLFEFAQTVAPEFLPVLEQKIRHIELADPPRNKTGSELLFEQKENSEEQKIKQLIENASVEKMRRIKSKDGLLGAQRDPQAMIAMKKNLEKRLIGREKPNLKLEGDK